MFSIQQLKEITDPLLLKRSVDARNRKMIESLTRSDINSLSVSANFFQVGNYISHAMECAAEELNNVKTSSK